MRRPARREQGGSTLVEFALVFPIVMLLVLGIIQYGYHFWAMSQAAAVAREVARLEIVNTEWSCGHTWGVRQAGLPAVGDQAPSVERAFPHGGGPGSNGVVPQDTQFTITVGFQSLNLGLFPLPDGGRVSESATGRIEFAPSVLLGGDAPQPCPAEYR